LNQQVSELRERLSKSIGHLSKRFLPLVQTKKARVLLLVLLLGIGALIVTGRQGQSGAASPTEVAEKLVKAIEDSDVLGVIDLMHPGERELLQDAFLDGAKELDRLGVIKKSSESQSTKLSEFRIENLDIQERCIADDICNISLTGYISGDVDGQTPLGEVFRNSSAFEDIETVEDLIEEVTGSRDSSIREDFEDITFTTIKFEGRWYASIGFTLAELIREDSSTLENDSGLLAFGKESPEEAVDSFFRAIEIFDVRGVVEQLDPREFSPAQRYAELFVKSLNRSIQDQISNTDFDWDITKITTEVVKKSSSTAQVRIKDFSIRIEEQDYYEGRTEIEIDVTHSGDDVRLLVSANGESEQYRLKDFINDEISKSIVESDYEEFLQTFMSVTTHKREGKWFVSPISSVLRTVLEILGYLEQDDVRRLLDKLEYE
jgi:hypothetical protein